MIDELSIVEEIISPEPVIEEEEDQPPEHYMLGNWKHDCCFHRTGRANTESNLVEFICCHCTTKKFDSTMENFNLSHGPFIPNLHRFG